MKNDIRIALVSAADPRDRRTWSGSTYFMASALERHVGVVDYIGPLSIPGQKIKEKLSMLIQKISSIRTYPTRTRKAATFFSREIGKKLVGSKYDIIFAPAASIEIAYLETEVPIIYVSDATFSLMLDVYPIFSSLTKEAVDQENAFEKLAIDRAAFIIYPSNWAARSAVDDYGADKEKVKVIPFGANLDTEPAAEMVSGKTIDGSVKILFLAKDWERKGGGIAFETPIELLKMGIDAELTICGITPPSGFEHPNMNVIPYLDKNVK
ncbi:MAG: glycosyltransferase, partial [Desulfobacterales bacterium]